MHGNEQDKMLVCLLVSPHFVLVISYE